MVNNNNTPLAITAIETMIKIIGAKVTVKTKYVFSIFSTMLFVIIMPTNNIIPPLIIITEINLDPLCLAIMNDTPANTDAGATPIEINCRIFAAGSMSRGG